MSNKNANTLDGWMDSIMQHGEENRKKMQAERVTRLAYMRDWFSKPGRIADMDDNRLLRWKDECPVLNRKYAAYVCDNERMLLQIWDEMARRTTFDRLLILDMQENGHG